MTIAGIFTMVLSIGAVWTLFIICCNKLVNSKEEDDNSQE